MTTSAIDGVVKDDQGGVLPGASVVAIHVPSGTRYETVTQTDGRFTIPGMRVGGPYTITVSMNGFKPETHSDVQLVLGFTQDFVFILKVQVSETVTVVDTTTEVFSSTHTGAATAVNRGDLMNLPTISGRINDFARLSPQYGGAGTFAGQDNRANNITIDGSYFNNSFGLGGQPGDRTGVAPVSLEAIEQLQVSVAPYDVRQGNFIGAGLNTVTRSGTNNFTGSVYDRTRNQSYVGKDAAGQAFNPGTFNTGVKGEWAGGPVLRNKLFFFESFESQTDTRPLTTFVSNAGGQPVSGNTTRVLTSDLTNLSSFLQSSFNYTTGPFDNLPKNTPAKPFLIKTNWNINNNNKLDFRFNSLYSNTDVYQSTSTSLGLSRSTSSASTAFLTYQNSNYKILENILSGVGEWNSLFHGMANSLIVGDTHQDESRADVALFPFTEIDDSSARAYTSFGTEPFTPDNRLKYTTFQAQDSLTMYKRDHSVTFGASVEKYHSLNIFFPGEQSAYVYNSLSDFYTDANGFLANPARTVDPITLRRFQLRYSNIPGQAQPIQPLDVWYSGGYLQDEWHALPNLTVTAGVRADVAVFGNTAYDNPNADALTFRNSDGSPVQYNSGKLPTPHPLWSPRVGFNWDVNHDQGTQLRGGTGVFTGKPPYVWISNQVGNTGMLTGFIQADNTTAFPFNPNPSAYIPTNVTGAPATSYELDVTDPNFRFPQTWRSNVGLDRKLPWGMIGTVEFIYNRDVNDPLYLNANLPAAQSAYTGIDNRPRWVGPSCNTASVAPCVTRLNNAPGNQVTSAFVIKNTNQDRSWNTAASVSKTMRNGIAFRAGYAYGVSKSVVEPGSTASSSWGSNPIVTDPNNPALAYSANSPGKRFFAVATYSKEYFSFGQTSISMFLDSHTNGNTSYIFSGDVNGDGNSSNDLIYIPRNESEMNFVPFSLNGSTVTAQQQADAFEAYIQADSYLKSHRGQYAQRNAVFLPMVTRIDLSLTQEIFHSSGSHRNTGAIRLDITNVGNLLNHNWGVGQRLVSNQILTNPGVDASGALTYRLATVGNSLVSTPLQTSAGIADVYVMMLSFQYTFK